MASDFQQNAAFFDAIAPRYDAQLAGNPHDALARKAFRDLVLTHVPKGSTILDFGCGTGLDALHYAHQGCRVLAYDNSAGMMTELKRRCRAEIGAKAIMPGALPYPDFYRFLESWPMPDAVAANFAVLNSIRELEPLFDAFARRLAAPGWVFLSVLNPIHWSRLRTRSWWKNALSAHNGPPVYLNHPFASYFHFVSALLRSAPAFHLVGRGNAGAVVRYRGDLVGSRWWTREDRRAGKWARLVWHTPAHRFLGHFVFLVLRRDP